MAVKEGYLTFFTKYIQYKVTIARWSQSCSLI